MNKRIINEKRCGEVECLGFYFSKDDGWLMGEG
jgi:hypothetical protein